MASNSGGLQMVFGAIAVTMLAGRLILATPIPTIAFDQLPAFVDDQEPGTSQQLLVEILDGSSGINTLLPAFVLKGSAPGPRLAITAAIHGDEVNGVPIVQQLVNLVDIDQLQGDIVAFPVLNPFGFARHQRGGFAGSDLNRAFLTRQVIGEEKFYAAKLFDVLAALRLEYHIDLHTATTGNDNAFYVRADLSSPEIADMARVVQPRIILNTNGPENTLRSAMRSINVYSLTMEMGGPSKVNDDFVQKGVSSLSSLLQHLGMVNDQLMGSNADPDTIVCPSSVWLCTDKGGLLRPKVEIMSRVTDGQIVAEILDLFGNSARNITAPYDGVVIGRTDRLPVMFGARIVHIGKIAA